MAQFMDFMPRFGSAKEVSDTGPADNFDVELLASYLLEDSNTGSGVTLDFRVDGVNLGSLVSPENSEDGNFPPIAELPTQPQMQQPGASTQFQTQQNPVSGFGAPVSFAPISVTAPVAVASLPVAATTSPNLPAAVPNLNTTPFDAPLQEQLLQLQPQQVFQQDSVTDPAAKRRRLEAPAPAMMGFTCGAPAMNGLQLAAAAQTMQQQGRGRKKSQAQIDRRRERNRVLAKRTRLRKKFFFESLQKEVMDLQRENQRLKDIVKVNLDGENSKKVLEECDALEKMPPSVLEACGEIAADLDSQDFNLVNSIQKSQHAFIITDPSLQDNPIVFASDDFLKMTGYAREQVLGRNCRFLQGKDTSKEKVDQIRKGLASGEDVSVTFINYKADGTPFWNKLFIAALRDAQNNVVNYIGVTVKVAAPEPNDPEHGKPLPQTGDADASADETD